MQLPLPTEGGRDSLHAIPKLLHACTRLCVIYFCSVWVDKAIEWAIMGIVLTYAAAHGALSYTHTQYNF